MNSNSASFAAPSTGGEATRISKAVPCMPANAVARARGWALMEIRQPPFSPVMYAGSPMRLNSAEGCGRGWARHRIPPMPGFPANFPSARENPVPAG